MFFPAWGLAALFCILFSLPALAADNQLTQVAIGDGPDYTRLAFTFKDPLESYAVRREDVDRLVVDFGPARLGEVPSVPADPLIKSVDLAVAGGRLTATVSLGSMRYEVRHFTSRDKYTCILDIKNMDTAPVEAPPETGALAPLVLPTLSEAAVEVDRLVPPKPGDGAAENLFQRILGRLAAQDYSGALEDLNQFRQLFPDHPAGQWVDHLQAEADFLSGPPAETYARATPAWKAALEKWPQSILANRSRFMLAEADRLMGQNNEAAAEFKILADELSGADDIYGRLALLRAADLMMNMGLIDEARNLLEPTISRDTADRLGLEAYARMGMADFFQGLFSQANEIFREALRLDPGLYLTYPEMLYATGEGYHYLNQPALARLFLFHALNLMPDHPKADVILARIGDEYRKEGRDREAMAVYGAAQRNFPHGDGGLISQVRLADMGALHSFFSQDKVFDALERGSRQATVEMYKRIVESGSDSPLLQLARLKIGTALAEDGDNAEAVRWLRDLEVRDPKSSLLPEALPALNRALADEILLREELADWQGIADLYADNSSYLSDEVRAPVLRVVARAYERLEQFAEARDVWLSLEEQDPDRRLARAKGLVVDSRRMGKPLEALAHLGDMALEFPGERVWMGLEADRIGQDLVQPHNAQATSDLVKLVDTINFEPARRNALADAIEIEINARRYDQAMALMDRYRRDYPRDDLTPEYILTQAQIAEFQKQPDRAWDLWSAFREDFPEDPRGADLLKRQIEEAEQLGRSDDALRFMELFSRRYPGTAESRAMSLEKMQQEWNLGRYQDSQDSLAAFRRDYAGDPIIPELLIRRSNQDWDQGRYEAARWAVDELMANYPQDPRVLDFLLARADRDWEKERYDDAQRLADDLTRVYPKEPRVGELLLKRADGDWNRGRAQAALKDWEDFRRLFPDDPRIGASYLDQYRKAVAGGQPAAATALAREIRQTRPKDVVLQADLLLEEAKDLLAAGQVPEALDKWNLFRQTFPADPRNPDLLLVQARQELKVGRIQDALAHYQRIIDQYPDHPRTPDVYLELAAAETSQNLNLPAWEHLDRFNAIFPNHPGRAKALLDQVELGRQMGRLDEAARIYRTFRADYPRDARAPATYLAQARLEIAAGRPEAAIATLEEGVLTTPALDTDANVQALLTDLYLETGRVEDWAAIVERNLGRADNPRADLPGRFLKYNQLAQVYQELGRVADAERNYDAALANRPPDASPETLYAIANAYKKMLRPEKYAAALQLLLTSSDPFWQKVATDELAALSGQPAPPQSAPSPTSPQ